MNNFENCNTKEDIMDEILKGGSNFDASKRFLKFGFTQESIDFYRLSQQENFLRNLKSLINDIEGIVRLNKSAGQLIVNAAEVNKSTASQMTYASQEIQEASRRMGQGNIKLYFLYLIRRRQACITIQTPSAFSLSKFPTIKCYIIVLLCPYFF